MNKPNKSRSPAAEPSGGQGRHTALVQIHIATLLLGGTALFSRLIPLPASHITLGRSVFAFAVLTAYALRMRIPLRLEKAGHLPVLALKGILLGLHWATYFKSMQVAGVAVGIISMSTYPAFTTLLEPLFYRERLAARDLISALAIVAGVAILVPSVSLTSSTTQGVLWGLTSSMLITFRNLLNRKYIRTYSGITLMVYQIAFAASVNAPLLAVSPAAFTPDSTLLLLILGVCFTAIPHALYTGSFSNLPARTVGVIGSLLPVYGILFAALVLGEFPALRTIVGGSIVVAVVVLETLWHAAPSARPCNAEKEERPD